MNTKDESQKPVQTGDHRTTTPGAETFEPEPARSTEPSDLRETAEGGYGWGV